MTRTKRVLVTAGLPYSNGRLHVGHIAGAYLPADIYVRFLRLRGHDVRFICGSDDHGVAIMLAAERDGRSPRETAEFYNQHQKTDFAGLGIDFDVYGATCSNKFHQDASSEFFRKVHEQGYFEKESSRQFYDESKDMFLPDRYVTGTCGYCDAEGQHGDQCENCGKLLDVDTLKDAHSAVSGAPAVIRETVHWFIDLSRAEESVKKWIDGAELRDHSRNYLAGLIGTGLVKRAMTRDIDWGLPVPLDDPDAAGKVLYVWFDAPIGYVSNTMELCEEVDGTPDTYEEWWKSEETDVIHFVGEDNTIFHCVIWIAMLQLQGDYSLPKGVVVNQYLNFQMPGQEEEKMSKSRGTAVWIGEYLEEGNDPDMLRYYLTAIAPERSRSAFNPDDLIQRNNSELANTIGNFVNRIVSFTKKYVGDEVPAAPDEKTQDIDREFLATFEETHKVVGDLLEKYENKAALEAVMSFARSCNKYVDEKAPWTTRKDDMEATKVTLNLAIQAIYFLMVTLAPFLPFTSRKLATLFGTDINKLQWDDALNPPEAGSPLGESEILFQKIEQG